MLDAPITQATITSGAVTPCRMPLRLDSWKRSSVTFPTRKRHISLMFWRDSPDLPPGGRIGSGDRAESWAHLATLVSASAVRRRSVASDAPPVLKKVITLATTMPATARTISTRIIRRDNRRRSSPASNAVIRRPPVPPSRRSWRPVPVPT